MSARPQRGSAGVRVGVDVRVRVGIGVRVRVGIGVRIALVVALGILFLISVSCKLSSQPSDIPDAAESPQAQAVPAPLAAVTATASAQPLIATDAGPPPTPLRADLPLHDEASDKPISGVTLTMTLRPLEPPAVTKAPEVNAAGMDAARKKTESTITVDLGAQRMRMTLGPGFLLPPQTELRARMDRTGHVLFAPNQTMYRVVAPSALRALFGERRDDVLPTAAADVTMEGEGPRRFGQRTRHVRVETRGARADLELYRVAEANDSAGLLCRVVLELMGASPMTPACAADELPARAEIRWSKRGGLVLEATTAPRRAEIPSVALATPPPGAVFLTTPLEPRDVVMFLSAADLAAMRSAPVEIAHAGADPNALVITNNSDEIRVLWLDGVMAGWIAPGTRFPLTGLLHGRYQTELRPFLSDGVEGPEAAVVPGMIRVGPPDAKPQN